MCTTDIKEQGLEFPYSCSSLPLCVLYPQEKRRKEKKNERQGAKRFEEAWINLILNKICSFDFIISYEIVI